MLANERQRRIQEMLLRDGAVTTTNLMQTFQVSIETIRRDLLFMEQEGLLTRVHGGAVPLGGMMPFSDLAHRNQEYGEEKQAVGRIAASLVREGDYIAIDSGSTAISFARAIKARFERLTVVTYSTDVFDILRDHRNFTLILCGGYFMQGENSCFGKLTLDALEQLHVQKSFVFPTAISLDQGICGYQQDFLLLEQKLLDIADHTCILADSSKFEKNALLKLDDMRPEYTYVTDSGLPGELRRLYEENGLRVITEEEHETF